MPDPLGEFIALEVKYPIWERFLYAAPLVLIGTADPDGTPNLAPKHRVIPLGWDNYVGFACTPAHSTYQNAKRENFFTVNYPRPEQVVLASMAAAPQCQEGTREFMDALDTIPATRGNAPLLQDAYVYLECELDRVVDDFGACSLVAGRVVAALVHRDARLTTERDPQDVILENPILSYVSPQRVTKIRHTHKFPRPPGRGR